MSMTSETHKAYNALSTGMCVSLIELFMRDICYSHDDRELLEVRLELLTLLIDKILANTPLNGNVYRKYYDLRNKIANRLMPNAFTVEISAKAFDGVFNQKFPHGFKKHLLFTMKEESIVNQFRYAVGKDEFEICQYLVSPEIISRLKIIY